MGDILVTQEDTEMTFAERLKQLRAENKLTLDEVAKGVGLTRTTIFRYEKGIITNVPPKNIQKLARFFGVSKPYMFGWSDDPYNGKEEVVALPDSDTFMQAYAVMTQEERTILTEIFIKASARLKK